MRPVILVLFTFTCIAKSILSASSQEVASLDICTEIETAFDLSGSTGNPALAWETSRRWPAGSELLVSFFGGTSKNKADVVRFSAAWLQHANLRLRFVDNGGQIRIGFVAGDGHWSLIGQNAINVPSSRRTMNIDIRSANDETSMRRVVLHEFGHALGFIHEHQHPDATIKWNEAAVFSYYERNHGWTHSDTTENIFKKYSSSILQWGKYDPKSIMHYSIPNELTLDDFEVGWNTELSLGDRNNARNAYPGPSDYSPFWTTAGNGSDGWYVGDYNGDGKDDVFRYLPGSSGADVFLSTGLKFEHHGSWTAAGRGDLLWHVGDFDGDGKDDIFRYLQGSSGADVFLSTGSKFEHVGSWTGAGNGTHGWYIGDFDGDGKDDIFRYLSGTSGADVFLSTGSKFEHSGSWTGAGNGTDGWHVGDFNGDGKDDIFRYMPGTSGAEVFVSTGSSFRQMGSWTPAGNGTDGWNIGDFDGDGKDDIFRQVQPQHGAEVFLSTGTAFEQSGIWTRVLSRETMWLKGDFNGDRRSDIARYLNGITGADVLISRGDRFSEYLTD